MAKKDPLLGYRVELFVTIVTSGIMANELNKYPIFHNHFRLVDFSSISCRTYYLNICFIRVHKS